MTRHIILGAIALCFACLASNSAVADNIGVGFNTQTSATAADNIGVGEPERSWYAVVLDWFESDDSA